MPVSLLPSPLPCCRVLLGCLSLWLVITLEGLKLGILGKSPATGLDGSGGAGQAWFPNGRSSRIVEQATQGNDGILFIEGFKKRLDRRRSGVV